ncbi:thioredoxin-like protein [Yamadazyma tenuis ATCC 10573]|uniref:Thioredoxin-like protein n=1 Tax=Candida tenuis (strain ATCC 10573 / BCRC 21748 / CBS 615 / JCM 9827 / NBRC 10315 / NRRL Y-1498 / VKM Y-70) TaxID=590646 RepID=G3BDB3_CANTC|nr:uncharacterized protein CANTEDRAFT_116970 [Yamadazyma tenuis ATCC 10573]XP_006690521.1 thioredoxin-like protein [Yamadazyma tenuis ATCC 10573]EGV61306.1 hypothetical protein CANTEDRAFT_116970 [Yamadazyma tenuis ATCC 10573]EGV61307.1 thioredoxin-like protein [Yamadazyma tenuis ATCC 10573]
MVLYKYILFIWQCLAVLAASDGFYDKNPNIYELTPATFDKVVNKSNYTTIVEFYAPWCGYCKQLKSTFQKVGKFIQNDARYSVHVAAVNCDKGYNKKLCADEKVTGFPTLKVFRPPKYDATKPTVTKHVSEVYTGQRSFKPIVDFLASRIKNYVKRVHSFEQVSTWLNKGNSTKRVLLVTEVSALSAMYKSLAVDYLGLVSFGVFTIKEQPTDAKVSIGDKEVELPLEKMGKSALLLIDTEEKSVLRYEGKLNDKLKISKWIMEKSGVQPLEGELSNKEKETYERYRLGKKIRKQKKQPELEHDEL